MPDPLFDDPRLAAVYDDLDPDRSDLDVHAALVEELGARSVLDVGCGTGSFACRLAARGLRVVAVDPAAASVDVARGKAGADRVTWVVGDVSAIPDDVEVDVATMTGNVAQVFVDDREWETVLRRVRRALRPDGHLVVETRRPDARAWLEWTPAASRRRTATSAAGEVETWVEVLGVDAELVSFRWTYVLGDGTTLTSDSTIRFRALPAVEAGLGAAGYDVVDVRDAPDRPGREWVVVARRR